MASKPGVEIYKRFYPMPERFRMVDPVLVREVTGMSWPQFVEALESADADGTGDPIVNLGMIAVAFWQGNPGMRREKVKALLESLWENDVEIIGGDVDDDEEAVAGPPEPDGETPSSPSNESTIQQDSTSETPNQNGSGQHGSDIGFPESHLIA